MSEIRIQEIDGQEFVPLKDYKRLIEKNEEKIIKIRGLEEKIKELEQLKPSDYELVIAKIKISDLEKENKEIMEEKKDLQETLRWYEKEVERLKKRVSILKYIIRR